MRELFIIKYLARKEALEEKRFQTILDALLLDRANRKEVDDFNQRLDSYKKILDPKVNIQLPTKDFEDRIKLLNKATDKLKKAVVINNFKEVHA